MAEMVDKGAWRAPVTQDGCSSLEWLTNDHVAPGTEGCVLSTCQSSHPWGQTKQTRGEPDSMAEALQATRQRPGPDGTWD